jgi:tRNA threonylcarbamoyladenosine biosynthesis protein TsaE
LGCPRSRRFCETSGTQETRPCRAHRARYTASGMCATVKGELTTHSAAETIAFGRTLAELLAPPKLVLLRGDLGAGKTTLVKGIASAFKAAAEEDVTSPTFTLVHEYRGPRANLFHIDLYRVDTPRELETLGLDDLREQNSVLLIEWGEKFPRLQRERDFEIAMERIGENERRIKIVS